LTSPTTNSYKRLVPGYEARSTWHIHSATAARQCAYPCTASQPRQNAWNSVVLIRHVILTCILSDYDGSGDGIQNKIDPGKPLDKNIYDLPPEEAKKVAKTPGSLRESLML